ncbi:MAG: ferrous iron transport protein B [bacterium]
MTLADLKTGEKAFISKVRGRGAFRKRILEMGFVEGKEITVIKNAPLKDPIEYNVLGYEVSLRRSEAGLIEVTNGVNGKRGTNHYNGVLHIDKSVKVNQVSKSKTINVALVGNPNSGKTTLFNHASRSRERVGNYGGVTVDSKEAKFTQNGYTFNLVDLPGTYSLTSYSPEEIYVREHLINELPDIVLNVVDSANLERNLYLTTQLIDMDIKVVMALNMWDEFESGGDRFDYETLGSMIGIPMVPTVGSRGKGLPELFEKIIEVYEDRETTVRHIHINYGNLIEKAIERIQDVIRAEDHPQVINKVAPRYIAIKLLEGDKKELSRITGWKNEVKLKEIVSEEAREIERLRKDTMETIITDAKYGFIEGALKETLSPAPVIEEKLNKSRRIDRVLTSKLLSYPIFVLAIWGVFQATFILGDYPMQWIEQSVAWTGTQLSRILPDNILKDLLIDGILGGVGGVIVFLPNILILFFFITIMEATGYMARVAFIVDKLMHKIGLHGKSFVPMLMGFGCNVPAIMATRTIENKNDRLVTMLILPFMSCSARYPVYILLISAFFESYRGTILFGIYLIGIILAAVVALILKKTLFRQETIPFVMELPPYRVPSARSVMKQTWFKGRQYLKKMGTIILVASLVIWALGYFPLNADIEETYDLKAAGIERSYDARINTAGLNSFETSLLKEEKSDALRNVELERMRLKQENSFIGQLGKFIEPIIRPLGYDWKMGVSLVAGSAAKEIVISTMGILYQTDPGVNENLSLVSKIREKTYEEGPRKGQAVFTPLVAFSYMLFILIYFPCIAVIAAIKHESGKWKWSAFLAFYTTALAWLAAFTTYQVGSLLGF